MKRLQDGWRAFAEAVAALSFLLMFAASILQVVSRYVFNAPIAWTLELSSITYVWAVFWSCDILIRERQHIVFDVFYQAVKPTSRRWVAFIVTGSLVVTFAAVLPGIVEYLQYVARRSTMLLKVRMDIVYSSFAIFVLAVVLGGLQRLRQLASKDWQKAL